MEGKERGMKSRNKSKNRKDSEEKITLQFVQLAVHMVNGKCDRLVLALITRRDTDYSLSTTQPVQSSAAECTCTYICTRELKREQRHRDAAQRNKGSPN